MRDLGNAAEDQVKSWCGVGGITANKAVIDRHGWDLIFEMTSGFDLSIASGLHQSAYECKVQIKATDGGPQSLSIKLSNLHAMATTALPSFYLLLDYAGGGAPQSAHLIHIDNELCKKILERVRQDYAEDRDVKLYEKWMSLNFANSINIHPLDGCGLKAAIAQCIGDSQSEYVSRKQQYLASAGYESGSTSISFQLDGADLKKFIGMSIGDESKVKVRDFKSFKTRFGIPDESPEAESEAAYISVLDAGPKEHGKMVFRSLSHGSRVEWEVEVFRAALDSWVPESLRLMRMRAPRFTIDIDPDGKKITCHFHKKDDSSSSIRELLKFYQFLTMLQESGGAELTLMAQGRELKSVLKIEGHQGGFAKALETVKSVQKLQLEFGYHDELCVSPIELSEKQVAIQQYLELVGGEIQQSAHASSGAHEKIIFPVFFQLGEVYFVSLVVFADMPVLQGGGSRVPAKPIFKAYSSDDIESLKAMADEVQKRASAYCGSGQIVNLTEKMLEPFRLSVLKKESDSLKNSSHPNLD
jgi:hypothetical protein